MVSFNLIPSTWRVPSTLAEFDNSRAVKGSPALPYRAMLMGQKLAAGFAADNSLHKVTNADAVKNLSGRGSILHNMAEAWFDENKETELWIGVLADASAASIASGSLTFSGTALVDGSIALMIGGRRVVVAVTAGDSASTIASAAATAIGKHASGTVTFSSADASDNITIAGTTDAGESISVQFVGTTGAVTPGDATYSVDTGNNEAAASFVAQVNAHASAKKLVRASAASAVVTLRAVEHGTLGNSIALTATDGTDTALSGATLSGGVVGSEANLPVHASVSSAVVTLRAMNAGLVGNEIDVRHSYQDGEALPSGVSVSIAAMSGGATNPTLTSLISAMGDQWFNIIAHPYTDATSLTAIENELDDRSGPLRAIEGFAITAKNASYGTVSTLGDSRNSRFSVIFPTQSSPTPPAEFAANAAAAISREGANDPALPLHTVPLDWVKAPASADRYTMQQRNLHLFDGIAEFSVGAGDQVQLGRVITTYQKNAAGSPDISYLDLNTGLTLMRLRYSFIVWFASKFARAKLTDDGGKIPPGTNIVTPKLAKAEAVAWFESQERAGLVSGVDRFKEALVVVRNDGDPNRLDMQMSPDLMNQLVVTANKIQFAL